MPGLPLQLPGDTPCTLRLGAFAAALAAAAARPAFPTLPGRASSSGWAQQRGSGGGRRRWRRHTSVSRWRFLSAFLLDGLTPSFSKKGDLFSGTGKNILLRRGVGGSVRVCFFSFLRPLLPPSKTKKQTPVLLQHPPSLPPPPFSTSPSFALSSPNYFIIMLASLGGLIPLRSLGSLPWMHFLKIWEPGSEFPPRRV